MDKETVWGERGRKRGREIEVEKKRQRKKYKKEGRKSKAYTCILQQQGTETFLKPSAHTCTYIQKV
jgi:hypothetical protein